MGGRGAYTEGKQEKYVYSTVGEIEGVKVDNNDSVLLRTLEVYLRSEDSASSIRIVGTGE